MSIHGINQGITTMPNAATQFKPATQAMGAIPGQPPAAGAIPGQPPEP